MDAQAPLEIPRAFVSLADPRRANIIHKFTDMLTIALLATICGADGWVAVVAYARAKESWLKTFLELPAGIPAHDTFGRLFARIQPDAFEKCFQAWIQTLVKLTGGSLSGKGIAIDGKSLRRSFQHGWDKSGMAHLVSAFVRENGLSLAQIKTDGKGRELDGIEKILAMLDLQGAVVTIDALGCQIDMARNIVQAKADYLLQVKDNQPTLAAKIQTIFDEATLEKFQDYHHAATTTTDGDHGRLEIRTLDVLWNVEHLGELRGQWPGLRCLVRVTSRREIREKISTEKRYYIGSLDRRRKAGKILELIRGHWSIENNLHWQLDVSFAEDQRRIRQGHGAENFSRLCRIALILLKNETTQKTGIEIKRQTCGWNDQYLLKVLAG
jgi:predicted transposase YbfD/YdcC